MSSKHIAEILIEVNKKITNIINEMENSEKENSQNCIDDLNAIIRSLDHVVEQLEKKN